MAFEMENNPENAEDEIQAGKNESDKIKKPINCTVIYYPWIKSS